jgi:RING finger/CHY zinc finger protein 1
MFLQAEDHRLPRQLLDLVHCNYCHSKQRLSKGDTCLTCETQFATYFCSDCGIANSDVPVEGYFHCDACGICRVGSRQAFFHCTGCGCCLRRHYQGVSARASTGHAAFSTGTAGVLDLAC